MTRDALGDGVAVVTGGASGIGRAIARRLAEDGRHVAVADRRQDPREGGATTAELIADAGGQATYLECDVTSAAQVGAMADAAAALGPIRVLVNNAGVVAAGPFVELAEAVLDRMLAVNVRGTVLVTQAVVRRMLATGGGSVVNVSSVAGIRGAAGVAAYGATKGAIRTLTQALAEELAPSIRVNAVFPGLIDTMVNRADVPVLDQEGNADPQLRSTIPLDRVASPDEVADAVAFLAGPMSSYVTGASLSVDGGLARL